MDGFIKYFALFTAIVAFLQPYLLFLYRRYFKGRKIVAYSFERLEVGFNDFGSYVGYFGSLLSKNAESFVHGAEIALRRDDGASLTLRWILTREQHIEIGGEKGAARLALGLLLKKDEPANVDLLFATRDSPKDLLTQVEVCRSAWQGFAAAWAARAEAPPLPPPSFSDFAREPAYLGLLGILQGHLFWRAGRYEGTLAVKVHDETVVARLPLAFAIGEDDQRRIEAQLRWLVDFALTLQVAYPLEKVFVPNLILTAEAA